MARNKDSGLLGCYAMLNKRLLLTFLSDISEDHIASEILVTVYQSTWHNIPEHLGPLECCCENLKSYIVKSASRGECVFGGKVGDWVSGYLCYTWSRISE
jgi:hypothetical protein